MYQIKSKDNITKYSSNKDNNRTYKIVVLADNDSASASEVLASALKEQKGAIIIGTKTYGKGTVQKTMKLSNGAMIKYTAETWLTSDGKSIEGEGIEPTIEVILSEKYYETRDVKDDNQLAKALEQLTK